MNKIKIEGIHCPSCAKNLENLINKLPDVQNAKFDFVKSTLYFESKEIEKATSSITTLVKNFEPDAKVIIKQHSKSNVLKTVVDISSLVIGIALCIVANFVSMPTVVFWILFVLGLLLLGYKTYIKAIKLLFKGVINENLLLTLSVIGATVLSEYLEASMVIALYSIGKIFEGMAVNKSRKSIEKLTNLQPEYAVILDNNIETKVDPKDVKVGTVIIVKAGERVPIDGKVISGTASIDMQSLTGESLPVFVKENQNVMSGSIVLDGVLKIETTTEYEKSTVNKILNLIEHASEKKSKTETTISKISKWYTLGVILCAVSVFGIVYLVSKDLSTSIYRGLIFLVVSCPCAFAISVPLSYFSGIGNASKHGILIKGSNYLDACSRLKTVAFDKTGTLTTGKFGIEKIESVSQEYDQDDILYIASLGEQNSIHPIAKSILSYNKKDLQQVQNVKEVAGEGVYFTYNNKEYFAGRKNHENLSTVVEVYEDNNLIGKIYLADQIKQNSAIACENLKKLGVQTVLLSGDNKQSVQKVANQIGIENFESSMLPQDKFDWIKNKKQTSKQIIGYVGDGINDSPSLMLADVGISMGINGSPASIEASDIVLVDDNPAKVATAIKISKYTQKIVWENIIFSAVIKASFLALGAFGITGMMMAVFADVGVTLLAILNSMRTLVYKPYKKNK